MEVLEINRLAEIQGGGKNRSCMIMGGLFGLSLVTTPWLGGGSLSTAVGIGVAAAAYGCFD
jgi:hypothetical protein